jgi:alpha-ketoglutarate-dependent taurine dioxygenase
LAYTAHTRLKEYSSNFSIEKSPFYLENEFEYQSWRKEKLERSDCTDPYKIIKASTDPLNVVNVKSYLSDISKQISAHNFFVFELDADSDQQNREGFLGLSHQLGLIHLDVNHGAEADGITLLKAVDSSDSRSRYIPYTNRALNWHTDGYYNPSNSSIGAFSLFCVNAAKKGGSNFLLDHEKLYIQIRDKAPEMLEALMQPDIMVIPANIRDNKVIRPAESGPVFSLNPQNGKLSMRFSARPHNIGWKSDAVSERAINLVRELLIDNKYAVEFQLKAGQGLICNNILHGRSAFVDGVSEQTSRLYYRARFLDSVRFSNDISSQESVN